MVEICLVILAKAVKLTKTDMDDQLLEVVTKQLRQEKRQSDAQEISDYKVSFL